MKIFNIVLLVGVLFVVAFFGATKANAQGFFGGGPVYVNSQPIPVAPVDSAQGYYIPRGGGLAVKPQPAAPVQTVVVQPTPTPVVVAAPTVVVVEQPTVVMVGNPGYATMVPVVPIGHKIKKGDKPVVLDSFSSTTKSTTTFRKGPTWRDPRVTQGIGASLGEPEPSARKGWSWSYLGSSGGKETFTDVSLPQPAVTMAGEGGVVTTVTTTTQSFHQRGFPQRGAFGGFRQGRRSDRPLTVPPDISWPGPRR